MKDFPGTPGTFTGLVLRILQCVLASGSIISMATSSSFFNFTAFCYLIASMGLQVIWSFVLLLLDVYALMRKKVLHNHVLVSLFVVGDWVTATLSLGAASASGGIVVLYFSDLGHCSFRQECLKYQISVILAFLSWISIAFSSLIMLWILAAEEKEVRTSFFFTVFIPLSTILVAMVAYSVLGEKLYLVCIGGGIQVMGPIGNRKEQEENMEEREFLSDQPTTNPTPHTDEKQSACNFPNSTNYCNIVSFTSRPA